MKQLLHVSISKIFLIFVLSLFTIAVWAQETNDAGETKSSTTTTTKSTDITTDANTWYTQPWVWIVGAAVFILLLVALLSGGKGKDTRSDRVIVKKTVERDSGNI
jgi:Mg2+/citrate symporter